jgi:YegS/Rv2252/BmrU family lipid kinase
MHTRSDNICMSGRTESSSDGYIFIVNPNSRSGMGHRIWNTVRPVLNERGIRYRVFFTKYQRHAVRIVRELTSDGKCHTIVVLGGDGTVNEVVNGIADLSKITLGYIPTGSSNDFARSLRLPTDPLKALDNILRPSRYLSVNIGVLTYDRNKKKRRFAVSSGIGFDAGICHEAMVSRMKILLNRLHLGKLTYVGIALRQILSLTPGKITLVLDDTRRLSFDRAYFATAMNCKYEGGGFKFCPNADCCDGLLDIIVISGLSKFKLLTLLPTAYKGWHTRFRRVYTFTCKKAAITGITPLPVHADGEPVFKQAKAVMSLEPEKLRVIAVP